MPARKPVIRASSDLRWMLRRDLPTVLSIECDSYSHPWDENDFFSCLRERNCIGMVAERAGDVYGYVVYSLQKHALEILNLVVAPEFRRLDVGREMIDHLKKKLSPMRRKRIEAVVWEKNLAAQLFFRACEFRACMPLIHDYHTAVPGDQGIRCVYRLPRQPGHPETPGRVF